MKYDIILCGVGGQGILSIAAAIGIAALEKKWNIKQAEVHGMSQRGGAVQSHLRLSDKKIYSDLIPEGEADMVLSVEPMESLRYLPYLSPDGWLLTNMKSFENIKDYPAIKDLLDEIEKLEKHIVLDADKIARDCGSAKSSNIVMLGAAAGLINMEKSCFEYAIKSLFKPKGKEVIHTNLIAFNQGLLAGENYRNT